MKKKFITCALIGAAALSLVACGQTKTPTVEKTPTTVETPTQPAFDAAGLVANFDESINTTVKATYVANYDVDITREGGVNAGFAKFFHKIRSTSEIEMDLGQDLYIKVSKTWQDLYVNEDVTETEVILYKKDGKFYYQTNSTAAVEVAAAEAQAKLEAILAETTYEDAGAMKLQAFLYNNLDKSYELGVIGLTDTFIEEDLVDPVYSENSNGGLHVVYKPEYIGYKTDMGMSDFSNPTDGYAAEVVIDTNNKGYVTSLKETYNSAMLDFAIMEPKPRVTITGSRELTAEYGVTLTKSEGLAIATTATYAQANNGTFVVKTCPNGQFGNMTEVANNGELTVGNVLAIKPTAAEGYEVDKITVNGSATTMIDPAQAGGFYCFKIVEGTNAIVVTFKAVQGETTTPTATVKYSTVAGGTYAVKYCTMGDFANMTDLANGGSVELGKILCIKPTAAEGYEVASVSVNGNLNPMLPAAAAGGYYCFNVAEGENLVVVNFKKTAAATGTYVEYAQVAGGSYVVNYITMPNFGAMTNLASGDNVANDKVLCIKPTAAAGYKVGTVSVNGVTQTMVDPAAAGGFYCFAVAEGKNEVVVTFEELTVARYSAAKNGTYVVKTCVMGQFTNMSDVANNGELVVDNILCIKVTPAEGYVVDTVSVNGVAEPMIPIAQAGGFYCFKITAGHSNIVVTFKAAE